MTREVVDGDSPLNALISEVAIEVTERDLPSELKKKFLFRLPEISTARDTYRVLRELLGISHTTVRKLAIAS